MRRIDPDLLAGSLVTLLCVATGLPVLLVQLSGEDPTTGPAWLWWLAFAGFVSTLIGSTWLAEQLPRPALVRVFAGQVLLGPVVVLLAPRVGWTPILLVFTAALSCYLVSRNVTVAIVAGNAVVAAVAAWWSTGRALDTVLSGLLYLLLQSVSVVAVLAQLRVERSRRELAETHTQLRAATTLLEDQSRGTERLRIARDLHDVVGHQLTALTLELEVASHHATPPAATHLERARTIARTLLRDVRDTVDELREERPDLAGLVADVVADVPRPAVHLSIDEALTVDERRTVAVVRCVQELLTNAIRHTDARHLWIDVTVDDASGLLLTARDDGNGTHEVVLGNGLRGMRERVEALGGTATFAGGAGFPVTVRVPAP
ncbi:sensor histidine kinase [Egicoccus sp. AB-alg2]|uniref:sensor histidine kinase n=1 Tax=Egicoccus sp. AB-alg2 TaxID=3242693 RepID=UPI00359DE1FA